MSNRFDIIIVGGNIVGLTAARALAMQGHSIAVIERGVITPPLLSQQSKSRVYAINRASQHLLIALDVWSQIDSPQPAPYQQMKVWDSTHNIALSFDCQTVIEPDLGHIVIQDSLYTALLKNLPSNITLLANTQLQQFESHPHYIRLCDKNHNYYESPLIIGADGARSWIRQQANISYSSHQYPQTAMTASVTTELPHQQTAYQVFTPNGPLAFLPLNHPCQCTVVWSLPRHQANHLMALSPDLFEQQLAKTFQDRLGYTTLLNQRACFPLHHGQSRCYEGDRVALVGDAAHTIHPLAGQGLNLGLFDVATLAHCMANQNSSLLGASRTLRRYARWVKGHHASTILAVEKLESLFTQKNRALISLRQWGLQAVQQITPLKNYLTRHALGLTGELPELLGYQHHETIS